MFRDVEDLLAERGITVSYETIRRWVNHFGPMIAADLRKRRAKPHTTWHLDEVYLKIDGRMVYLWRPEQHDLPDPGCDGALHGGVGLRSCCRRGGQTVVANEPGGKLVKIGAKVVRHGCYVIFQMAEVAVSKELFQEILRLIDGLRPRPAPA